LTGEFYWENATKRLRTAQPLWRKLARRIDREFDAVGCRQTTRRRRASSNPPNAQAAKTMVLGSGTVAKARPYMFELSA
jgi:hypothetical protein